MTWEPSQEYIDKYINTVPLQDYLIEYVNGAASVHTAWCDENGFSLRFCYGGDISFNFRVPYMVVTGTYQNAHRAKRILRELEDDFPKFSSVYELPNHLQETVRRQNGDTHGVLFHLADPKSIFQMERILDRWLFRDKENEQD